MKEIYMDEARKTLIIEDRETLKVMVDPLRSQILEILLNTPHTIKQTAGKLGLAASKLYYHFNQLEKHGLIEVVETRMVANLEEKLFQSVAINFELAPGLLNTSTEEGKAVANELFVNTIEATREDLLRSLQARYFQLDHGAPEHPRRVVLNRMVSRISEALAGQFQQRLCALLEEFEAADSPPGTPDTFPYAFMAALYPSFYYEEDSNG
jgi:DNA-binding transcriptional ArsR family regulator